MEALNSYERWRPTQRTIYTVLSASHKAILYQAQAPAARYTPGGIGTLRQKLVAPAMNSKRMV